MKKRGESFAGKVCGDPRLLAPAKLQAHATVWQQAFTRAVNMTSRLLPSEQQQFSLRLRSAITSLAECRGSKDDWAVIVGTILQIEALGKVGVIKTGCAELVDMAQQTVEQAMNRHQATGSNVLLPIEITSLNELADNWDLILGAVTVGELNKSSEIAMRKRTQALAKGEQEAMVSA